MVPRFHGPPRNSQPRCYIYKPLLTGIHTLSPDLQTTHCWLWSCEDWSKNPKWSKLLVKYLKIQRDKRQSWRKEHTTKNHMKTNDRPLQRAKLSWKQIMEVAVASFPQRRKSVRVNMKLLLSRLKSWIRRLLTEYYNEKDAYRIFWKDIQRKGRDLFMLFGITNVSYFFNIEKMLTLNWALVNIFQFWFFFYINQALKWMKSIDIDERGFITEQVY